MAGEGLGVGGVVSGVAGDANGAPQAVAPQPHPPTLIELFTLQAHDPPCGPDPFSALAAALAHARPAVVHASASSDACLLAALRRGAPGVRPALRLERSSIFSLAAAHNALCGLAPPALHAVGRGDDVNRWLGARLDLSQGRQVIAAGALLAVLARDGVGGHGRGLFGGQMPEHSATPPAPPPNTQ